MTEQASISPVATPRPCVLIAGASFAGLASAYWMSRLGYTVTVVETAPGLKRGGTPVDLREGTVDIMKRMGLFEQVRARRLPSRSLSFKDACGATTASMAARSEDTREPDADCEIDRDVLLDILFQQVRNEVEFRFGDSIAGLRHTEEAVEVGFRSGLQCSYAFVIGCDGNHSALRRLCFGPEADYDFFMQHYFALAVVDKLLLDPQTTHIINLPGVAVMLNAYDDKTDVVLAFFAEREIPYDYRDVARQRQITIAHFPDIGPGTPALLAALTGSPDFYFDRFCQIRMPAWHRGRVVLVGDAAYCASPAAGMGGSLALVGASALAEACTMYPDDLQQAFLEYDRRLRPFVEQVQGNAIDEGLPMFVPRTEDAIRARNAHVAQLAAPE